MDLVAMGGKKSGEGELFSGSETIPAQLVQYQCRHLMIDVYFYSPKSCDDNFLNHEVFFGLQQRLEKFARYVKFYIKEKQEKRVFVTPRQREEDRLELIYEVLVFNPYIPPFPLCLVETKGGGTFDCKASDLQPKFLIDTLNACENQKMYPDKGNQIFEDLTKFYEEVFIPEGGVPLLQHKDVKHHFLWVFAECRRDRITFYYSGINLVLASSNSSNPNSEPTVHITWYINTTSSASLDLVEFEHFYDEKADGFKRHAKILSGDAAIQRLKMWRSEVMRTMHFLTSKTRAPGSTDLTQEHGSIPQSMKDQKTKDLNVEDELVQIDTVDTLEEKKALEREGSARMETDQTVESGVDEVDVKEFEGKEEKLAMQPADKLQGNGDIDLDTTTTEPIVQLEVDKLQGNGDIDLAATTTEPIVQPKVDKLQVQKGRKPGRKGHKPKHSKAKVEPLSSEGPPEIVPSDNDAPNEAQMEDKNANLRKKSKAPLKDNVNRKKKQRRKVAKSERSAGREKEQAVESGVDELDVIEFEGKEKKQKLAMEPADKLQGNEDIGLEVTKPDPIVQPKVDKLQVQKGRKPGRKGRKLKNSKAKVEPLSSEGPPEVVLSDNDAPKEAQIEDKNANLRKKSKVSSKDNAGRKKKQRTNHPMEERDPITIDNRCSSSSKEKDSSKRRGKRQNGKEKKAGSC